MAATAFEESKVENKIAQVSEADVKLAVLRVWHCRQAPRAPIVYYVSVTVCRFPPTETCIDMQIVGPQR